MKRSAPLRRMSKKRRAALPAERAINAKVIARDRRCILADVVPHPCGPPTPHHLRKSGQGGETSLENVVVLCATMNVWVEDNPETAWGLGLVIWNGESAAAAWERMAANSLVSYGPDGGPIAPIVHPI